MWNWGHFEILRKIRAKIWITENFGQNWKSSQVFIFSQPFAIWASSPPPPLLSFLITLSCPSILSFFLSSLGNFRPTIPRLCLATCTSPVCLKGAEWVGLNSVPYQTLPLRMSMGMCEGRFFVARECRPTTIFDDKSGYQLIHLELFFNMMPLVSDESRRIVGTLFCVIRNFTSRSEPNRTLF